MLVSFNNRIRFCLVSVTNTSPSGVKANHRGLSKFSAKILTLNPGGTFKTGLLGMGITWGGLDALSLWKGGGKSSKLIRIGWGDNGFMVILFWVAVATEMEEFVGVRSLFC